MKNKKLTRFILVLFLILTIQSISSELSCPYGEIDCKYPGDCGSYTDSNKNELCDYSEIIIPEDIGSNQVKQTKDYNIFLISTIVIMLYIFTYLLFKFKKILLITHRKIWNILLFISFLGVGISGIVLTIRLEYNIPLSIPLTDLFWHVETGIVMTLIAIFHTAWHLSYYKSIFNKR